MIKNLDKINIIKRKFVENGMCFIEQINKTEPVVNKIVVFGSAISDECTEDSDIDLCIYSDYNNTNNTYMDMRGKLMDKIGDICDILTYSRLNDNWKEIVDKGVVVYEK